MERGHPSLPAGTLRALCQPAAATAGDRAILESASQAKVVAQTPLISRLAIAPRSRHGLNVLAIVFLGNTAGR
jgi:hypothetical protein